ncbi:hypothetical protein [Dyadobacter sp. CY347]|uniref:hypothetical protein n=1 Tax=Dyadobacter sp. CY347 TaxID=2909336 RepID=UPI001F303F02|nr:hypothetical protein [Dyadobacter sp. CY347]MCF2487499.1 hypothetical protein [Dyadobacter sp. CY347]
MSDLEKATIETTFRMIRLEKILDYLVDTNPTMNFPSQEQIRKIELEAANALSKTIPGAKWTPVNGK